MPPKTDPMNFNFFHRPELRKFNYKPQFYVPEEEKPINYNKYDRDNFGEKLHRNWESKRKNRSNKTGNMRAIIWMAFIVLLILFVLWKLL